MNDQATIGDPSAGPTAPPRRRARRARLATVAVLIVAAAIGAMWIYAWFFAPRGKADRFDDPAWQARAQQVCASTVTQVRALPPAASFKDIRPKEVALVQRAAVIDQATALLTAQVAQLRADEPTNANGRKGVALWLDDWDGYLQNRRDQAQRMRAGEDTPFRVKEQGGAPVTLRMDEFAKTNGMPSCIVPDDIG